MKIFITLLTICVTLFFLYLYNVTPVYSEFENKICIQNPTIQCIEEVVNKYGIDNIKPPQHRFFKKDYKEEQKILEDEFTLLQKNQFFDPLNIENRYSEPKQRIPFVKSLIEKTIRNTKYGAGYPHFDSNNSDYTKYLKTKKFQNFKADNTFISLINYWTENTKKLLEDERNKNILEISALWLDLNKPEKSKSALKGIDNLSKRHSYKYLQILESFKDSKIPFPSKIHAVSPYYQASLLILLGKKEKAKETLIKESKELFEQFSNNQRPDNTINIYKRLKTIATLLEKIDSNEDALTILNKTYELEKNDVITGSFISKAEYSRLYRSLGENDKALEFMEDYKNRNDSRSCQSFHFSGQHLECAEELVYLGFPEIAYKKMFKTCRFYKNCWPLNVISAAMDMGYELPDFTPMIEYHKNPGDFLFGIAKLHAVKGKTEKAYSLLKQAIENFTDGNACSFLYLLNTLDKDNKDLIRTLYKKHIQNIFHRTKEIDRRMWLYKRANDCFKP